MVVCAKRFEVVKALVKARQSHKSRRATIPLPARAPLHHPKSHPPSLLYVEDEHQTPHQLTVSTNRTIHIGLDIRLSHHGSAVGLLS